MKIVSLKVENFRSINDLTLNNLGNINIFVGKNNAGKSTVLKSIESFVKILDPKLVNKVFEKKDFYQGQLHIPIKMACSLMLKETQFNELMSKMKDEYPQLGSGVEDLRNYKVINVYTSSFNYSIGGSVDVYSYIEKITLSSETPFEQDDIQEKNILSTDSVIVEELITKSLEHEKLVENIKGLEHGLEGRDEIKNEDYRRYKDTGRFYSARILKNYVIKDLMDSSNDYHQFRTNLREEIENRHQDLETISNQETNNEFSVFPGRSRSIPPHISWLLNQLSNTELLQETERKAPIEKEDAERLLDLKISRGGQERLNQLQSTVTDLLGVNLDAFKSEASAENAEIDIDNFLVDMNGAGIRESLRLLLDFEFSKPEIVLIEEPEVHLHFELERKIFRYLVKMSNEIQIFMTTHSTGFIDSSEVNNIYLVKKEKDTKVASIKNDGLIEVIGELGINISSLLLSKVIVFVEGPTDEEIVRMYLETFHPNLSYSDVGIIRMTGVGNYKYYANAYALKIFGDYGLGTIFILDSDSRSEQEIEALVKRHPSTSELRFLSKRCIENYFLVPSILLRFIQMKMTNAGIRKEIPTDEDLPKIEDKMIGIIESLYPETLRLFMAWRYLKPIYPLKHFNKDNEFDDLEKVQQWLKEGFEQLEGSIDVDYREFEEILPTEIEKIEKLWAKNKMDIVPGDKVIDMICSEYGVRYNKKQMDIELLSQVISKEEWPSELTNILGRIEKLVVS